MKVELRKYTSWESYHKNVAQGKEKYLTIRDAMKTALEEVRERKKEIQFVGYKIFDKGGKLRQKLHNQ